MKKLITGGLLAVLGWLAQAASAQDIQFRAAPAKAPAPTTITQVSEIRAISVGAPTPLGSNSIVRGQAADEKPALGLPKLEVIAGDQKDAKPLPKDPKDQKFTPPPPSPVGSSPVFGSLGMNEDGTCGDWCGSCFGRLKGLMHFGGRGADCCNDRPRWWVSAEYLMWWQRSQTVPPLVTSSPAGQVGNIGVLGDPRTTIVFDDIDERSRGGARFGFGWWSSHACNLGFDFNYFFLSRSSRSATFASDGNPQLARPFFDVERGVQDAEIFTPGSARIETYSQLWGIDGALRHKWINNCNCWVDVLYGYRHLNLNEGLYITEDQTLTNAAGTLRVIEQESFQTRTQFNGGFIGLQGERRIGNRFFLGWTTKVALGNSHHMIDIDGNTTFIAPAPIGTVVQPGALLATPTNIGSYSANRFAVAPEVGLKIGYNITDHLRIYAGYDFLYLSSVVRPAEQIDLNVAPSYRPTIFGPGVGGGPRQPTVVFRTTDYWAQGFNFGLQYRY